MNCDHCPCPGVCHSLPAYCEWAAKDPPNPIEIRHICDASAASSKPAPSEYPPLGRQVVNLAGAVWDWARSGFAMAPDELRDGRIAICRACPKYDEGANRCRACGCHASAKVEIRASKCPDGRW